MGRSEETQPELSLEDVAKGLTRGKDRGKSNGTQRRELAGQGIQVARMWGPRGHWLEANLEKDTGTRSGLKLRFYPEGTMNPLKDF